MHPKKKLPQRETPTAANGPGTLSARIARAIAELQGGHPDRAMATLAAGSGEARKSGEWTRAYALIYAAAGDNRRAAKWYTLALEHAPADPTLWAAKAMALQEQGLHRDAVACYDRALSQGLDDAETHYNRATALHALGDMPAAAIGYAAALARNPGYHKAREAHALALLQSGRFDEALRDIDMLCVALPDNPDHRRLHAEAMLATGRFAQAVASFDALLQILPPTPQVLVNLGIAHKEQGHAQAALAAVERALAIAPHDRQALLTRANVLEDLGRDTAARAAYRTLAAQDPVIPGPAIVSPAEFRALFLFAPTCGNTPVHDMTSFTPFDHDELMVMDGIDYRLDDLRRRTDLVFNLISDIDVESGMLATATRLIARLDRPTLNHPAAIAGTDRQSVSRALAGIGHCIVPSVVLYTRAELLAAAQPASDWTFPLIVRAAGRHGGEDMEKVDDATALATFVANCAAPTFYLTEFVDYRSADNLFRKYRFMFVGDRIMPYHLAIGRDWKVHHAATDMHEHAWMMDEEQRFLADPAQAFAPNTFAALRAVRARFSLDYFGIDCGIDREGRLVVFEVNASMLAHLQNDRFPYKTPHVLAIKHAFADMLRSRLAKPSAR